jgi:hypothetical protein
MKGPLANLKDSIERMTAETHAALVTGSALFAQHGDPRNWTEFDGSTPITWLSGRDRQATFAAFDEWASGAWNHVPGVVRPGIQPNNLPLVS